MEFATKINGIADALEKDAAGEIKDKLTIDAIDGVSDDYGAGYLAGVLATAKKFKDACDKWKSSNGGL
jgi:hypothetical protein